MRTVICALESLSPYSQSDFVKSTRKEGETYDEFETRCWQERVHVDRSGNVFIPPMALKKSLEGAASNLGLKRKGNSRYTPLFRSSVIVPDGPSLGIKLEEVESEWLYLDGNPSQKGSSKVRKCMPLISEWRCEAQFIVISSDIPKEIFERHVVAAGSMVGIGRFRPEKGGYYGRFMPTRFEWKEE